INYLSLLGGTSPGDSNRRIIGTNAFWAIYSLKGRKWEKKKNLVILRIIFHMKTTTCPLNIMPSWLLKEVMEPCDQYCQVYLLLRSALFMLKLTLLVSVQRCRIPHAPFQ
ncbi:hypothetical protein ABVT39_017622, partial [Epinephelus coioides]